MLASILKLQLSCLSLWIDFDTGEQSGACDPQSFCSLSRIESMGRVHVYAQSSTYAWSSTSLGLCWSFFPPRPMCPPTTGPYGHAWTDVQGSWPLLPELLVTTGPSRVRVKEMVLGEVEVVLFCSWPPSATIVAIPLAYVATSHWPLPSSAQEQNCAGWTTVGAVCQSLVPLNG